MGEATDQVTTPREPSSVGDTASTASDTTQSARQIRSEIEQTRSHLSATIDALQDKLDPSRIAEQVKDQIREKATEAYTTARHAVKEATIGKAEKVMSSVGEAVTNITGRAGSAVSDTGSSFVQYVQKNPAPFVIIGVGVGLLVINRNRDSSGNGSRESGPGLVDVGSSLADKTGKAVNSAATSLQDVAGSARQQWNDLSGRAAQGKQLAAERFNTTLEDNPLALGIAALAAGAILGLALPSTRFESEHLGEAREKFVGQAKSVAHDVVEKVQRVTEEAGHSVKEAARKEGFVNA